jgi:chaperonin GroEL
MTRHYSNRTELHQKILEGVDVLADNVASTLGPRGRNVILHQKGKNPITTKDGVTVAKFVELEDPIQNAGAQILKQAADQTNTEAGDGTTTSTVLARAILKQAQRYLISGASPIELKRGIDKAVEAIVEKLEEQAVPISSEQDIAHIATISANGDESIGKLIATAVDSAGKDGAISVEEARSLETSLELTEGFIFDSGYVAGAFVTDERKQSVVYDDPVILVTDYKIETVEEIYPILEVVAREAKPFIIVAEEIEGQALAALIMNAVRGTMKVAAIKAPRYGEERRAILHDLALSTGATFVSRLSGLKLKDVKLEHLGLAEKIESFKTQDNDCRRKR